MISAIEARLSSFEESIVNRLIQFKNPLWPLVFCGIIMVMVVFSWPLWTQFDYLKIAHWDIVKNVEILFVALVILAPLPLYVPRKYKTLFYVALAYFAWFIHCYFKNDVLTANPLSWIAAFAVPALMSVTWLLTAQKVLPAHVSAALLAGFSFFCALMVGLLANLLHKPHYIELFWMAHVEIFVVVALIRLWLKRARNQTDLDLTLNPINLLMGIFWPIDLNDRSPAAKVASRELWWRGYYTLLTAFLFHLISMAMVAGRDAVFSKSSFLGNHWMTLCIFLALTAVARFTTGMARIYGVDVPDCSNFVFLSRSPVDTLRRGYVYAYEFNLRYVCLPLMRQLRSMWISVFLTFVFYVFFRFVLQPLLVPMFYNAVFPELLLYTPGRELAGDIGRAFLLLAAFFVEPLFLKLRMLAGKRYGDLVCIVLTYLFIAGMRAMEPDLYRLYLDHWKDLP